MSYDEKAHTLLERIQQSLSVSSTTSGKFDNITDILQKIQRELAELNKNIKDLATGIKQK
jgi:archaellum component FlaC